MKTIISSRWALYARQPKSRKRRDLLGVDGVMDGVCVGHLEDECGEVCVEDLEVLETVGCAIENRSIMYPS